MRVRETNKVISVHAIAGTEVILLGIDATAKGAKGLLGFSIYKRIGNSKKEQALGAGKIFAGVQDDTKKGKISSDEAPIQAFMWSDYEASPNTSYTYRVVPVYGKPGALKPGDGVEITVKTEDPDGDTHAIYFNRGVAGSQAYSRLFGKYQKWYKVSTGFGGGKTWTRFIKPEDVPNNEAFKWLSRGLEEGLLKYIGQASGPRYSLRASIYEFTYKPVIEAFVNALESSADVKIIHHYKETTNYSKVSNKAAVTTVDYAGGAKAPVSFKNVELIKESVPDGIASAADKSTLGIGISDIAHQQAYDAMLIKRTDTTISHNKFIILLKDGQPEQVWTGSTNLTAGGIFGQSNVGHIVRDPQVAAKYYEYWQKLATDPGKKSAKTDPADAGITDWNELHQADLAGEPPPNSITPIFSPRKSSAMLSWYADRMAAARNSVHFTAAFTVADQIFSTVTKTNQVAPGEPYLRYLLLEGIDGLMKPKYPDMAKVKQNRIAWGDVFKERTGDPLIESLTGLNDHVNYLHTKYLLIDPLSDDPVVITGSANFSDASTVNNDENMLVIRGNTRVADIFLGEFMRLFNHFRFRNRANARTDEEAKLSQYLKPDDSWTVDYYTDGTKEFNERILFK